MFEKSKGIAKGTKLAEAVSKATMNTVNYIVRNTNENIKTHDTLFICTKYYCYASILTFPENMSKNKFIKYTGAKSVQAKNLLEDWLVTATGVYSLGEYIEELDDELHRFGSELKKDYIDESGQAAKGLDISKSYAAEKVLNDLREHFNNHTKEFSIGIGRQCERIRNML